MNYKRKIDQCNLKPILLRWTTSCQIWREKKDIQRIRDYVPTENTVNLLLYYYSSSKISTRFEKRTKPIVSGNSE